MKIILDDAQYSYAAATKVITLVAPYDSLSLGQIISIRNLTVGEEIYNDTIRLYPVSISGADITHTASNDSHSNSDVLQIVLDVGGSASTAIHVSTGGVVASTVGDGRKTVSATGTAEALASTTPCKEVTITAELDNTDVIVVGGSTVVAALATRQGTPLYPGDSTTIETDDLAEVFLDVIVDGEGATYTYLA